MGLVWKVCGPDELLAAAAQHARTLAEKPVSSLKAVKRTMTAPLREEIAAARERENQAFVDLMGGPANAEALAAFAEGRAPDFTNLPDGW
jgi:enoyl-CoA hydratase/carnithine racemase